MENKDILTWYDCYIKYFIVSMQPLKEQEAEMNLKNPFKANEI